MLECYPNSNPFKDVLTRANYISRKPIYDFLKKVAKTVRGGVFLDFGCGNMPYKPLFKNADEYIGLDVDTAKEYGFQANGVTYYDGRDIPFSDCSVDYILSVSAFEHIYDLPHTLEELFRVLKHGGTLCATVPMIFGLHYEPYDFRRFTYYGLIRMMEQAGFHHIECSGSNRPVDTMRFLGIYGHLRILRPLRVLYANLSFLIGRSKAFLAVENMARRVLGRGKSELYMESLPLDLLLVCSKD